MVRLRITAAAGLFLLLVAACGGNAAVDALAGAREIDMSVCDPAGGPFTLDITNPYLPYAVGQQTVLEGPDGSRHGKVQITVLDETEDVAGVTTRVVEEREWIDDALVEVSRNFVAQAPDGSVCYYGEEVDDYRNGQVVGHGGAWRAGENGHQPGILMPATPAVGSSYRQEIAEGIAEDAAIVTAIGEPFTVPAGTYDDTLAADDVDPLSGGIDPKRYARGIGLIVDERLVLTSFSG